MSLRQLFCTSRRSGLSGSAGFQINAATPGIDTGLLREMEGLCRYQPPPPACQQPTEKALAAFPISLSFTLLDRGGAAISRSVYIGADDSGRCGHCFAHILLPNRLEKDLGGRLPIELWGSSVWVSTESSVAELPSLDRVEPGCLTRERVAGFLQAGRRINHLPSLLAAVLEALKPSGRRVVLVAEDTESVASWIAAACYSLPYTIATRLSFTTYTLRPQSTPHRIIGATPEAQFDFSPDELRDQYHVFDLLGQRFSPAASGSYGTTALHLWQAGPPEAFINFDSFVRYLDVDDDPAQLHAGLAVFALGRDIPLNRAILEEAVRWISAKGTGLPEQAWSCLAHGLELQKGALSLADWAGLARAASGLGRPLADRFTRCYLKQLFIELVVPDPDPYVWRIEGDIWLPAPLSEEVKFWLQDEMDAWIPKIRDASRAVLALRLMSALAVRPKDGVLGSLGVEVLGPAVFQEPHGAIVRALAIPAGVQAREGVLEFLDRKARLEGLGLLVDRLVGPLARWMQDANLERFSHLAVAARIAWARSRPAQRIAVLDQLLSARELDTMAAGADVDRLVSLLWAGGLPSASEGLALLQVLPEDLGATRVPRLLVRSIAEAAHIDRHVVRLATSLAAHLCFASLGPGERAVIDAVCHGDRFRRAQPDSSPIALATRLLGHADSLPEGVHRWLIGALCRWLIGGPPSSHVEVLHALWPPEGRAMRETYPAEMIRLLADHKICGPAGAASVFVAWRGLDHSHAAGATSLLDSALPAALRKWPEEELDEVILALIRIDTAWVPAWNQWRDKQGRARLFRRG